MQQFLAARKLSAAISDSLSTLVYAHVNIDGRGFEVCGCAVGQVERLAERYDGFGGWREDATVSGLALRCMGEGKEGEGEEGEHLLRDELHF